MTLTQSQAAQIAALLNARNQLTVRYTAQKVLDHAENYRFRSTDSGEVAACVEVKKVQWYQAEVLHLTVAETELRRGHAKALLASAEELARKNGARLLQCTIREDNVESQGLFKGAGFAKVNAFYNEHSGNNVAVLQKVVSNAR